LQILGIEASNLFSFGNEITLPGDGIIYIAFWFIKGDLIAVIYIQDGAARLFLRINAAT
jgi:hypothetical protein